ncbi:aldehyde dehydrogenase family protein [Silvibacterium sp.]|uniref:aldehyde dehydrogenase family protein n=1 Tax=Silvibacterium sp. TaxID=1964179 RepID=UPI0039E2A883
MTDFAADGSAAQRMQAARHAQTAWAKQTLHERASVLHRLRHVIAARIEEIVAVIQDEIGKPPLDTLAGDILVTLEQIRFDSRHAREVLSPRHLKSSKLFFARTRFLELHQPHGVVLVIAPWNYPLQLSLVPAATALLVGNAVLLKCSEHAPRTAKLIQELLREAGLPDEVIQVSWEGPAGAALLLEAQPDLVFFTGSSAVGREIVARCGALLIPSVMELGGKDAALIFATCELARTVEGVLYGVFSNSGQVCVGIKRLYVERAIYGRFLEGLLSRMRELRIGKTGDADLGEVFEPARRRLSMQLEDAVKRGARLHRTHSDAQGEFSPVVVANLPADARLLTEDSFGPVVCIFSFDTEEEGIRMANESPFALSASVWTGDRSQGERVAIALRGGSCAINDVIRNIGSPEAAFGGNGDSGSGRYHGLEGIRTFSRVKVIMTNTHPRRTLRNWFPFSTRTYQQLAGVLRFRHGSGSIRSRFAAFRRSFMGLTLIATGLCLMPLAFGQDGVGTLSVDVLLPAHAQGQIAYLVFTSAEGFPDHREKALLHGFVPLTHGDADQQKINLGALKPGRYAVSVFLDENSNGKLDHGFMGIPKEPVGASNNPKGRMGPPKFDECVFEHGSEAQDISIRLVH